MRNTTRQSGKRKEAALHPSKESQWAYGMQAIESKDNSINAAFPGFHPQWVQQSQRERISAELFISRRLKLGMNPKQCAAYLRISECTLQRWERGYLEIPFMAYELLRVLSENLFTRLSHKAWDGWFISDAGKLVSPNYGRCEFRPEQLEWISWQGTEAHKLRVEVDRLQRELDQAQEENTTLRQMFLEQGVVDELYSMRDRMTELVKQMATARIVPFQKKEQQAEAGEKAA